MSSYLFQKQTSGCIHLYMSPKVAKAFDEAITDHYYKGVVDQFVKKLNKLYLKGKITAVEFTKLEKLAKSRNSEDAVLCEAILKAKGINVVLQSKDFHK